MTAGVLASAAAISLAPPAGACIFGPWEGQVTPTSGRTTLEIGAAASLETGTEISLGTEPGASGTHAVALPVRGGTVWTKSAFGTVNLGGAIVVRDDRSNRTVTLHNVVVSLLPNPSITADIGGSGPMTIFTLSLGPAPDDRVYRVGPHRLVVGSSVVRVSESGAIALDTQLGTRAFSGGCLFGTLAASATVT